MSLGFHRKGEEVYARTRVETARISETVFPGIWLSRLGIDDTADSRDPSPRVIVFSGTRKRRNGSRTSFNLFHVRYLTQITANFPRLRAKFQRI